MDDNWLQARITATQTLVEQAETVLNTLLLEGTSTNQSYTINTGQSVVTVTKKDVKKVESFIASLLNRITTMEARLNGGGAQGVPGW